MRTKTMFTLVFIVFVTGVACLLTAPAGGSRPPTPTGTLEQTSAGMGSQTAANCVYYVAPGGDDTDPGTLGQPWATFQHAADTAQVGDTVCFRGGTYSVDEETHLTQSGTTESPITFIAYPGETPVLDGGGSVGELLMLDQYTSYLRISGFTLRNCTVWGMELSGENRHIQLDHLNIGGGETSIRFTYGETEAPPEEGPVEHITLEDSTIHGSLYSAVDCTPGPCNHMVKKPLTALTVWSSPAATPSWWKTATSTTTAATGLTSTPATGPVTPPASSCAATAWCVIT
jgi:hypothetical protein